MKMGLCASSRGAGGAPSHILHIWPGFSVSRPAQAPSVCSVKCCDLCAPLQSNCELRALNRNVPQNQMWTRVVQQCALWCTATAPSPQQSSTAMRPWGQVQNATNAVFGFQLDSKWRATPSVRQGINISMTKYFRPITMQLNGQYFSARLERHWNREKIRSHSWATNRKYLFIWDRAECSRHCTHIHRWFPIGNHGLHAAETLYTISLNTYTIFIFTLREYQQFE